MKHEIQKLDFGEFDHSVGLYIAYAESYSDEIILIRYYIRDCHAGWEVRSSEYNGSWELSRFRGIFPTFDEAVAFANAHWVKVCTGDVE